MKRLGINYELQPSLLEQAMNHDETYEETWEDKEHERLPYLKNDALSTVFCYARCSKFMEERTGFGMKNSVTSPSFANKYFNKLKDENDEPIYTYNDKHLRWFVKQSKKGGRCSILQPYYKSIISDEVFNIISEELNDNCNICEISEKYF